jgi:Transposase
MLGWQRMDVHQTTITVAVRDPAGKMVMESILETKASTILEFIRGLGGNLSVTFEEGSSAAWLYDLLKPHVAHLIVCDPRKNALLKAGNKKDRIDPRKLTDLLRAGLLSPVYHGESGARTLQELARTYLTVTKDLTRVMNRLKGVYRSSAIPCAGQTVYAPRHRSGWLEKLAQPGVRRRAEQLYAQLDKLVQIRREARQELLRESRQHPARPSRRSARASRTPARPGIRPRHSRVFASNLIYPDRLADCHGDRLSSTPARNH